MRNLRIVLRFSAYLFVIGLFYACTVFSQQTSVPGVTYVNSRGNPRANSITWSPMDPNKILVNAINPVKHNSQVYILDILTHKKTVIVDTNYGMVWGAWSPNGKKIALSVEGGAKGFPQSGLWMMNTEDNSLKLFFDRVGVVAWLPDGNTLAFLTKDFVPDQIPQQISVYLVNFQTKEMNLIYSNQDAISYSGFSSSSDGKYLVFSINSDHYSAASDLYILDVRAGIVKQITHDKVNGDSEWSPKGDLIVYVKSTDVADKPQHSLHITLPDGACDVEVPNIEYAFSPTWSPDGKKIAFIGEDGIYVLDTNIVFGRDIYQNLCP